jgi:hypothetical protein
MKTISDLYVNNKLPTWKELKVEAMRLRLDCSNVFTKLDDATIEKEFNYIGPDRLPEKIRLFLSYLHKAVLPAVLIHDLDFVVGGSKDDFHQANLRLKENMYTCVKYYRNEFTWLGYHIEKWHIRKAYKLTEKYGYPGWHCR